MQPYGIVPWLKKLGRVPAKWHRRSRAERLLLLEALVLLGCARLTVLVMPFRWLASSLGAHMYESGAQADASDLETARAIGRAVRSAAKHTPWKSVCLPQAVAGQWMLKRRQIAATLHLGVAKEVEMPGRLAAHAWLRCGDIIVTGKSGYKRFRVVATFAPLFKPKGH